MAFTFERYYHSARTAWNWKKFFWALFNIFTLIIFGITLFKPGKLAFAIDDQVLLTELTTLIACITSLISIGWFYKGESILALTTALNLIALIIVSIALINPSLLAFLPLSQESLILTSLITACITSLITIIAFAFENKNSVDGWETFCRFNQKKAILLTVLTFLVGITLLCGSAYSITEIVSHINSIYAWALAIGTLLSGLFLVFFVGRLEKNAAFAAYKNDPIIRKAQTANNVFDNAKSIIEIAEKNGITAIKAPENSENSNALAIFYVNRLAYLIEHYSRMVSFMAGTSVTLTPEERAYVETLQNMKKPKPSNTTIASGLIDQAKEVQRAMLEIERVTQMKDSSTRNSAIAEYITQMEENFNTITHPSILPTSTQSASMNLTAKLQ